jgi:cytochrome c oxidase cbb3-type subunit 1
VIRALGGLLFLSGALVMVYNCWRTIRGEVRSEEPMARPAPVAAE